jgi:hypothetical protein
VDAEAAVSVGGGGAKFLHEVGGEHRAELGGHAGSFRGDGLGGRSLRVVGLQWSVRMTGFGVASLGFRMASVGCVKGIRCL